MRMYVTGAREHYLSSGHACARIIMHAWAKRVYVSF